MLEKPRPRLGIGAASRNTVAAAISAAYRRDTAVMVVASRGQIESAEVGGGYLGWSAADLADHVRARDPRRRVLLCRDHGGPWQHRSEPADIDEADAMDRCLRSFRRDIEAGFHLIHIDTSVERGRDAGYEDAARRLASLYEACAAESAVAFEIGFEPQDVDTNDIDEFKVALADVLDRIGKGVTRPRYVVAQTGTKVLELANYGALMSASRRSAVLSTVKTLSAVCHDNGLLLKAHNCDYLTPALVRALVAAGVDAMNVAPEFGVTETRRLLAVMAELGRADLRDRFLRLAYDSAQWRKWLRPGTDAGDHDRAVIAGHYVFQTEEFHDITADLGRDLARRGMPCLDEILVEAIEASMSAYLDALR